MNENPFSGRVDRAVIERVAGGREFLVLEGWLLHESEPIVMLQFSLPGGELMLIEPLMRPELSARFPDLEYAPYSGYRIKVPLIPGESDPRLIYFCALIADGFTLSGCIEISPVRQKLLTGKLDSTTGDFFSLLRNASLLSPSVFFSFRKDRQSTVRVILDCRHVFSQEQLLAAVASINGETFRDLSLSVLYSDVKQLQSLKNKTEGVEFFEAPEKSLNDVAESSDSVYLLFVDASLEILPGTIQSFVSLARKISCGVFCGKIVGHDAVKSAGGNIWRDGEITFSGKGLDPSNSELGYARRADFAADGLLFTSRKLFIDSGGLDSFYPPGDFPFIDFSLKLSKQSIETWYTPGACAICREEFRPKVAEASDNDYRYLLSQNKNVFLSKERLDATKDDIYFVSGNQKKILVILPVTAITSRVESLISSLAESARFTPYLISLLVIGEEDRELTDLAYPFLNIRFVRDLSVYKAECKDARSYQAIWTTNTGTLRAVNHLRGDGFFNRSCKLIFFPDVQKMDAGGYAAFLERTENASCSTTSKLPSSDRTLIVDTAGGRPFTVKQFLKVLELSDAALIADPWIRSFGSVRNILAASEFVDDQLFYDTTNALISGTPVFLESSMTSKMLPDVQDQDCVVTVIVPYFNQIQLATRCIDSILNTTDVPYQLILVDDGSDESGVREFEELLASKNLPSHCTRLMHIKNHRNRGFAVSVNQALAFAAGDVVLVNSDVILPRGWLSTLKESLRNDQKIASITPFSNNGSICTLPVTEDNATMELELINTVCRDHKQYGPVELPTGVGFCLLLSATALREIGFFDSDLFSPMYGEENDWCLQAALHGMRNVLLPQLFVYHQGNASLPDAKAEGLLQKAFDNLTLLYPDYHTTISKFEHLNPIGKLSTTLSAAVWRKKETKRTVLVFDTAAPDGGSTLILEEILAELYPGQAFLFMECKNGKWMITDGGDEPAFILPVDRNNRKEFLNVLDSLRIEEIFVNNIVGWSVVDISFFLLESERKFRYFAHDYYPACPRITLIGHKGTYCGAEQDPVKCSKCLSHLASGKSANLPILDWRDEFKTILNSASNVYVPGRLAAHILTRYYPDIRPKIFRYQPPAHCNYTYRKEFASDRPLSIGIIGAIGDHKGYKIIKELHRKIVAEALPCRIVVIGYTSEHSGYFQSPEGQLIVSGPYKQEELSELLANYRIGVTLFASIWPETYLLTADEAYRSGYPAISFSISAAADRIVKNRAGWVLQDIGAESVLKLIQELLRNPSLIIECARELSGSIVAAADISNHPGTSLSKGISGSEPLTVTPILGFMDKE